MLFRTFIAFYVCAKISVESVTEVHLSFLEYLTINHVSANMISNYISATKANFTILG